jgi:hypothetical protein
LLAESVAFAAFILLVALAVSPGKVAAPLFIIVLESPVRRDVRPGIKIIELSVPSLIVSALFLFINNNDIFFKKNLKTALQGNLFTQIEE